MQGDCANILRLSIFTNPLRRISSYEMGNSFGYHENYLGVSDLVCVYVTCETGYQQSEQDAHITASQAYRAAQTSVASWSSV